jgi:radical SAM protein
LRPDPSTFDRSPLILFWETTRACPLACVHCRASAIRRPLPGELTEEEGAAVVEEAAAFDPKPLLVLTGGDPMQRRDLHDRVAQAQDLGLRVSVAPAVADGLDRAAFRALADAGVGSVSLSLDGATAAVHDGIRQAPGTWRRTLQAFADARDAGLRVQTNTAVLRRNVHELADIFARVREAGAFAWEVFFLVRTGRGIDLEELTPEEYEQVCHFLYDASGYGVAVRTTEGPQFRRVALEREAGGEPPSPREAPLYHALRRRLGERCGPPGPAKVRIVPTRDGRGILFVAHDGAIHPSGFLPLPCGNVRTTSLLRAYREDETFRALRDDGRLKGRCARCAYREVCGGSRSRAYAVYGDAFAEDAACPYVPA